jgi:hypothetical protein
VGDDDAVADAESIRKQVSDLRPDDLARYPIWEFALDEEGQEGQDEETVKPRPDLERANPAEGLFIVRADFVAADGTRFDGYVSPDENAHIRFTRPTMVTPDGQVQFWFGGVPPRPGKLEASYQLLRKSPAELFPIYYRACAEHDGAALDGAIAAFMHLESMGSQDVVSVT